MPSILVSVEGVSSRRTTGKPRLLLRRQRRKIAKNLLRQLKNMENQEFAENRRSAINNYEPFMVFGAANSRYNTALALLKDRLIAALAATA